ncbi:MAG: cytochrome c [Crocinitomicaceae bacterium]|nr:cytochrome c [Crocinitomicaceae bacterium]
MKTFQFMMLIFIACVSLLSCEESGGSGKYDVVRGIGKFNESNVDTSGFDLKMAQEGARISETKCASCHKFSKERLVGPGWKGVTERRAPFWIMNFITNPDEMIDNDPDLMNELDICLTRMPNQNLTDNDARSILEYMRQIDGAK